MNYNLRNIQVFGERLGPRKYLEVEFESGVKVRMQLCIGNHMMEVSATFRKLAEHIEGWYDQRYQSVDDVPAAWIINHTGGIKTSCCNDEVEAALKHHGLNRASQENVARAYSAESAYPVYFRGGEDVPG